MGNSVVRRAKVLLIDDNNRILLANTFGDFQFLGGHIEENEDYVTTITREIEEEAGIVLDLKDITPVCKMIRKIYNYHETNKDTELEIYYFIIYTNQKVNIKKINRTKLEKDGNMFLKYVPLKDLVNILIKNKLINGDKFGITLEMLYIIKYLKENNILEFDK